MAEYRQLQCIVMLFKKNLIWLTVLEFIELAIGKVGRWLFGLAANLAKFSDGGNYYFFDTLEQLACDSAWPKRRTNCSTLFYLMFYHACLLSIVIINNKTGQSSSSSVVSWTICNTIMVVCHHLLKHA